MMSRRIGVTLLLAACACLVNSRGRAEDRPLSLFSRLTPHARQTQDDGSAPTFRGQTPRATPGFSGPTSLPRGRAYYNNRYFGNFNNRFYGPQYGYF